jgi:hypothetical protein
MPAANARGEYARAGEASRLAPISLANPEAGGTIDVLLDGTEGQKMMDNLTVDHWERVLVQEDPGNNPRLAKVWSYSIKKDTLTEHLFDVQWHSQRRDAELVEGGQLQALYYPPGNRG